MHDFESKSLEPRADAVRPAGALLAPCQGRGTARGQSGTGLLAPAPTGLLMAGDGAAGQPKPPSSAPPSCAPGRRRWVHPRAQHSDLRTLPSLADPQTSGTQMQRCQPWGAACPRHPILPRQAATSTGCFRNASSLPNAGELQHASDKVTLTRAAPRCEFDTGTGARPPISPTTLPRLLHSRALRAGRAFCLVRLTRPAANNPRL